MGSCEYHYLKQAEAVGVEVTGQAVTIILYVMYVLLASINSSQFKLLGLELE